MNDIERRWHKTYTSDKEAKPMLGAFSGGSIAVLLGSIILAMITFFILTAHFDLWLSLAVAAAIPMTTSHLLKRYVVGKHKKYLPHLLQYKYLKHKQLPLLTEINTHEK